MTEPARGGKASTFPHWSSDDKKKNTLAKIFMEF